MGIVEHHQERLYSQLVLYLHPFNSKVAFVIVFFSIAAILLEPGH